MAAPWAQPVYGWAPQYYNPGYWQYVPTPYPMYQQLGFPAPGQQFERVQPGQRASQIAPPRLEPQLHRFLGGQRRPTAVWDVAQKILTAQRRTSRQVLERVTPQFLAHPATDPPLSRMRIVCESFPWDVNIQLPPRAPEKFITIGIVLESIFGTLHEPLDPEEWRETCPADKKKIYKAMCSRLAQSPPSISADGCVSKIDCLLDRTAFLGLRPGGPSPEQWILSLGPKNFD